MDPLGERLAQLNIINSSYCRRPSTAPQLDGHVSILNDNSISAAKDNSVDENLPSTSLTKLLNNSKSYLEVDPALTMFSAKSSELSDVQIPKKFGPLVPPKPFKKKKNSPEVPQSYLVKQACEPLYSKRLQSLDVNSAKIVMPPTLQRKQSIYGLQNNMYDKSSISKVTLDNPVVLEQQLEVLAHHKNQLEKKKLLQKQQLFSASAINSISCLRKLSSTPLVRDDLLESNSVLSGVIFSNLRPFETKQVKLLTGAISDVNKSCLNKADDMDYKYPSTNSSPFKSIQENIYSNLLFDKDNLDEFPLPPGPSMLPVTGINNATETLDQSNDDDIPPPPSPVSSSYSELQRATDLFSKKRYIFFDMKNNDGGIQTCIRDAVTDASANVVQRKAVIQSKQAYMNYGNNCNDNSATLQGSSTYESIYEPINPRPASQMSTRSNSYLTYAPYGSGSQLNSNGSVASANISGIGSSLCVSGCNTPSYPSAGCADTDSITSTIMQMNVKKQKETEVEVLTNFLVHSLDTSENDMENYGTCFKCNERVLGENSGCTAMNQIYHIACFTCSQCQINLQGKPFYALDGKPFCEFDYLQTLEKCSVCMKPILERILRATGKPYHPQCFTCIVCSKSLDGIPFTVDATNQNYCIADFHKKFAPRCCVCMEPIMPEPGEEETVRVVALDRSFHFECYKCEDCGLLLSSEAEGRGCYPLDGHVLCKSCNAERVQMLTTRMTTEL